MTLILTSRNGASEPLAGVLTATQQQDISTPGKIQQATINVTGELKKTVNLTPFNVDQLSDNPLFDANDADDLLFGGLGDDFIHGGVGDDGILGGEALLESYALNASLNGVIRSDYTRPYNSGDLLRFNANGYDERRPDRTLRAGEFALYDEYDPLRKILIDPLNGQLNKNGIGVEWLLNFNLWNGHRQPRIATANLGVLVRAVGQRRSGSGRAIPALIRRVMANPTASLASCGSRIRTGKIRRAHLPTFNRVTSPSGVATCCARQASTTARCRASHPTAARLAYRGALKVTATSNSGDAVAVNHQAEALPGYFELSASIRVDKPTVGCKANAYMIFDYQGPADFKFTGVDVSTNKLVMGHRDASGWKIDKQASFLGSLKHGSY
jgi:Ca2+-binding RTX toxin-like protein